MTQMLLARWVGAVADDNGAIELMVEWRGVQVVLVWFKEEDGCRGALVMERNGDVVVVWVIRWRGSVDISGQLRNLTQRPI